jgi:hypothetical protein
MTLPGPGPRLGGTLVQHLERHGGHVSAAGTHAGDDLTERGVAERPHVGRGVLGAAGVAAVTGGCGGAGRLSHGGLSLSPPVVSCQGCRRRLIGGRPPLPLRRQYTGSANA